MKRSDLLNVGLVAFVFIGVSTYLAMPLTSSTATSWLADGSLGFELVKGLPAAFVALVIGVVAAGIAYRQYTVQRAKLNLDLFEQRYALFALLWAFLSARVGDVLEARPQQHELQNSLPKFYFLFGPEIGDFVAEALRRGIQQDGDYTLATSRLGHPSAQSAGHSLTGHYMWFFEQANGVRDRFGKFLDFQEWR